MQDDVSAPDWANEKLEQVNAAFLRDLRDAESGWRWLRETSAEDLFREACAQLRLADDLAYPFDPEWTALDLGQLPRVELTERLDKLFPIGTGTSADLADQVQLLRAFSDPDRVTAVVGDRVASTLADFPRVADDIRTGRNPGDVLDPFILSANFELLSDRRLDKAIEYTASHKILMKVENLIGNLHQDVLGLMRGNARVPEPIRGAGRERKLELDFESNPFPGVDVAQVPASDDGHIRLFQIKSKTGSATGGSGGESLGGRLRTLEQIYDAETFYAAIVGTTLRGHRSIGAVLGASPNTVVLVGHAALQELTRSAVGAELLLRTYQRGFRTAIVRLPYDFERVVLEIAAEMEREAEQEGEDFLTAWLHRATEGAIEDQDSRHSGPRRTRRARTEAAIRGRAERLSAKRDGPRRDE